MARFYRRCANNSGRCCVCSNKMDVFPYFVDYESGWMGWCMECNAFWHRSQFDLSIRACSRDCSVHLLNELAGCPKKVSLRIREFLLVCDRDLRRDVLTKHKFTMLHLRWSVCPVLWLPIEEGFIHHRSYDRPLHIRELKIERIKSPGFLSQCFPGFSHSSFGPRKQHFSLMDAITTYVATMPEPYVPRHFPENEPIYRVGNRETSWQKFERSGRLWLCSDETGENFPCDMPPRLWRQYFHRNRNGCLYSWWCSGKRWFFEPELEDD